MECLLKYGYLLTLEPAVRAWVCVRVSTQYCQSDTNCMSCSKISDWQQSCPVTARHLWQAWSCTGKGITWLTGHVSPIRPVCFLRQLCVLPKGLTTNTNQTWEKGSILKHCNSISRIICMSWAVLEHHCEFKWTNSGSEISYTVNRWKQT